MKRLILIIIAVATVVCALAASAPRRTITLADGWTIKPISNTNRNAKRTAVSIPHTWNATYPAGSHYYNRETMVYERQIDITPHMQGKRLFLYFEGVNSVADVFVNRRSAGTHKGGYTAFCIEITGMVKPGANSLEVWASNAFRTDVLPISGDFNVYGGIHRPVHLIATQQDCISPLFHASPGVLVRQDSVSPERADISVETLLSMAGGKSGATVRVSVKDHTGRVVAQSRAKAEGPSVTQKLSVSRPTLWQGKRQPYLYTVEAELESGGSVADRVTVKTGLRSFRVDPERGFMLNGAPYPLYGFNRHDDFKGVGSALLPHHYRRDMQLIEESGATMIRLAHYPHGNPIYHLADSCGIVLWSEIPLCGPGGYLFAGYVDNVADNARQTAREMVYQKFNHPSVCFWGIFNELLVDEADERLKSYDPPVPMAKEINRIFHQADPSRLTCFATCAGQSFYHDCADLIAWNKYFGWKDADLQAARFFDARRTEAKGKPVGVSEYGRGGSTVQHADPRHYKADKVGGRTHPEEYQTLCHEGYWKAFARRPWLWARLIWQMADMQSCIKDEGDTPGVNDKGMITYDRRTRKDAFYFYKANWNPEPMLHLAAKRFVTRRHALTDVKAFTNLKHATLYVNGRKIGRGRTDSICRIVWPEISLKKGENTIRVEGRHNGKTLTDQCRWVLE